MFLFNPYRSARPLTEENQIADTYLCLFFNRLLLSISPFVKELKLSKNNFSYHRNRISKSSRPVPTVSHWGPPPQEKLTPMVFILMILANKYNSHTFLCSFQFIHIGIDIFSSFYITTKPHKSVGTVSR